uniref:Small-subunit processome Utp12 domain-containing protein n=1 Tax=Kalanchoe fedtschenkoi TaxID=63787 RepID=A0A7N0T717_KALFE
MTSANSMRDVLTAFSPSSDYLAISSGDGRIKIWDTLKGQMLSDFSDLLSNDDSSVLTKSGRGHLSVDYTCIKWISLDKKKKRKLGYSLVVLGTGTGDILALDAAAGHLKWKVNDCHPGGVTSISFSSQSSSIYSAGADGIVCKIDCMTGNMLEKFKASTKAISSLAVSPDGKLLATASAQLKVFKCANHKKLLKFSGHPGAVRCMTFTEDGNYLFSSSLGEKYIAVWEISGEKKQSASCVLNLEHPAVLLDARCNTQGDTDDPGLYVLAISEIGVCYIWYGKSLKELRNSKPTKVSVSSDDISSNHKGTLPTVLAAKLDTRAKPASHNVFVAYGLLIKPSFQRILVNHGLDVILNSPLDGILLPLRQYQKFQKKIDSRKAVSALDRANAEEALLPIPKLLQLADKKTSHAQELQNDLMSIDDSGTTSKESMEGRLRSLGILSNCDGVSNDKTDSAIFKDINLKIAMPQKKMKAFVLSMGSDEAYKFLRVLVNMWQSKILDAYHILPWINSLLLNHNRYIVSQESATLILDSVYKISKSRGSVIELLLQLSGRLKLVTTQIDIAVNNKSQSMVGDHEMDKNEDDEEDADDVEETLFDEEYESDISSNDDEKDGQ